jgi:integrase
MANKDGHRRFGNIRKRESGRWQARYLGPDGQMRSAPHTFARKEEAARWLALTEARLMQGDWIDPERGKVELTAYADRWITERPKLRPRTIALYRQLLRTHIAPYIGDLPLSKITTPTVRSWRTSLLDKGVSRTVAAKSYRLLRAVLNTAVKEDELIRANPCRIPGADSEETPERPVLTLAQVFALAEQMPAAFRAMIVLTTFGCLRWGEVTALQRRDLDVVSGTVRVRHAFVEVSGGGVEFGPPKSRAGLRTVSIPPVILPILIEHLVAFVPDDPEALVFAGPSVRRPALRRNNFRKLVKWPEAVAKLGVPGLHFHDLRHTGNTLAAGTGASTRDLMTRMGHDSTRAALIYQHATAQADKAIADALSAAVKDLGLTHSSRVDAERPSGIEDDDGTAGQPARVS